MTTDEWVHRVNELARMLDEWASMLHPSVWTDQLGDMMEEYRKLCAMECEPDQLSLFDWEG